MTFATKPNARIGIFGKIRWVLGGGVGMKTEDWFDLAMHGAPWLWLLGILVILGWRKLGLKEDSQTSN